MACGCSGKSNAAARVGSVPPALTVAQLRAKMIPTTPSLPAINIVDPKPSNVPTFIIPKSGIVADQVFKRIESQINPLKYTSSNKTVILITRNDNAESKYLKNILTKFALIELEYKKSIEFLEIEYSYLLNPQDFKTLPVSLLFHKNKIIQQTVGLYDVKTALNELYKLKQ